MNAKHLTTQEFKDKIFDYSKSKEWKFNGDKPAIIDFYADWCGPCKMLSPLLEELAGEYHGKVDIFKVNTEKEMELSQIFDIRSIPSILFIPKDGQPMMQAGLLPKNVIQNIIEKDLLKEKEKDTVAVDN
ncbi:MAG: thioredoxin [Bacteroidetes bacterium]|nr:thioredoxin [Bacteroidota bacterium]